MTKHERMERAYWQVEQEIRMFAKPWWHIVIERSKRNRMNTHELMAYCRERTRELQDEAVQPTIGGFHPGKGTDGQL